MNKLILSFLSCLFYCSSFAQAQTDGIKNGVPFEITKERHLLSVPVSLTDKNIKANMLFDTGWGTGFSIDTSFVAKYPSILEHVKKSVQGEYIKGYSKKTDIVVFHYGKLDLYIGDKLFVQTEFHVGKIRNFMEAPEFDCFSGIPMDDSIHVWTLNFEENKL